MIRLRDRLRRVRNAVREWCSDDSSEYEMVGGKCNSERKPTTRKAKTAQGSNGREAQRTTR